MGDSRRAYCKDCERHADDVGELSWMGYCVECWQRRLGENVAQMMNHKGPQFHKWRRAMAATVGGVLLEDLETKG